jgi:hypothetical protein
MTNAKAAKSIPKHQSAIKVATKMPTCAEATTAKPALREREFNRIKPSMACVLSGVDVRGFPD